MKIDHVEKLDSGSKAAAQQPAPRLGKATERLKGTPASNRQDRRPDDDLVSATSELPAEQVMEAARQDPPDLDQVNQLLHDAPPEEQRNLLEQLDGEELAQALGHEEVTQEQRARLLDELSRLSADHPDLQEQLGESLAAGLDQELGDLLAEALEQSLEKGSNAGLGVALARHAGDELGDRLMDKMAEGLETFYGHVQDVGDEVSRLNADLGYLVQSFGPMMSEEELQAAIEQYRTAHPEYAELERLGGSAVANLEHVQSFSAFASEHVGDDDLRAEIAEDIDIGSASTAAALALPTASGQAELGDLLAREGNGEETWLSTMQRCAPGDVTRPEFRDALFTTGISQAAAAQNDPERARAILEGISASGGMLGLEGERADQVTAELQSVLTAASTGDPDTLNAALDQFDEVLGGLGEGFSASGTARLRSAGTSLGIAGLGLSGAELATHPSFENLAAFMAEGTELAADLPKVQTMLQNAFGGATAARVAGGAGVLMSLWDAGQSFRDGDVQAGLLNLGGALGGYLVAAGSTGVGLLVSGAAALGLVGLEQWRKAQDSNHFENHPGTRMFLEAALADSGLSGDELQGAIDAFKNTDPDGRLNGILIQQGAESLGMDPGALLNQLAALDSDDLNDIMDSGFDVDPSAEDDVASLPSEEVRRWVESLRQYGLHIPCGP